ncbi:Ras_domain-containing protein [Hexamita inflata]|uniref:Ras domain-containing protein n=1 Tax=Hexamita inflata TaxID=28002 RepID=A0AA86UI90_9EUKA|nr:Ras domain-containing protein [Hexamita inflata]
MEYFAPVYIIGDNKVGKHTVVNYLCESKNYINCQIETSATVISLSPYYVRELDQVPDTAFGVFLVYDITHQPTFDLISSFSAQIQRKTLQCPDFAPLRVLVGTHRDQVSQREVSYQQVQSIKESLSALWFEVSPTQNLSILKKQLSIRAVFACRAAQDHTLPIVPATILSNVNNFNDVLLPKDYNQRLVQLVSDEEFRKLSETEHKNVRSVQIHSQAQDHIAVSHFFEDEVKNEGVFENPFKITGKTLEKMKMNVKEEIIEEGPEPETNVLEILQNENQIDLRKSFKAFLRQIGAEVNENQINKFMQSVSDSVDLKKQQDALFLLQTELQQKIAANNEAQQQIQQQKRLSDQQRSSMDFRKTDGGESSDKSLISQQQSVFGQFRRKVNYLEIAKQKQTQSINQQSVTEQAAAQSTLQNPSFNHESQLSTQQNNTESQPTDSQPKASIQQFFSEIQNNNKIQPNMQSKKLEHKKVKCDTEKDSMSEIRENESFNSVVFEGDDKIQILSVSKCKPVQSVVQESLKPPRATENNHKKVKLSEILKESGVQESLKPKTPIQRVSSTLELDTSFKELNYTQKAQSQSIVNKTLVQTIQEYKINVNGHYHTINAPTRENPFETAKKLCQEKGINHRHLDSIATQIYEQIKERKPKPEIKKEKLHLSDLNQSQKIERKELFKMDIIAGGRRQVITIKDGDNIAQLGENFCRIMNVDRSIHLQSVISQIRSGFEKFTKNQ